MNIKLPSSIYAVTAVNSGAEDFIVSENETATHFNAITEQTIAPNLNKNKNIYII